MTDKTKTEELEETQLDNVQGGMGLLLPAVQIPPETAAIVKKGKTLRSGAGTKGFGESTGEGPSTF